MICHTKKLRLFANVEMIAEILRIVLVTHFVDPCRQKFACAVRCNLLQQNALGLNRPRAKFMIFYVFLYL